jgi:hypothetical protein
MYKAENFGISWLDLTLPFPCEIHHCTARAQPDPGRFSVLSHFTEPRPLKWPLEAVRQYAGLFDLILTNEESLLDLPNAMLAVFGSSWVDKVPLAKRFEVSFLYSNGVGSEQQFAGYRERRGIWGAQESLQLPKAFYTSTMRPPEGIAELRPYPFADKTPLFESMFSIIVENDYQPHYFTEKIVDALRSYTVPIYFGAPNIGRYFDARGMLLPSSLDEMVAMINRLRPEDYWSRLPAVQSNYELSRPYWGFVDRLGGYVREGFRLRQRR